MSEGWACDRCGAAIFKGERTTLDLELKGPDKQKVMTAGGNVLDLCPKCARSVATIVRTRVITTDTRPDAWFDSEDADNAAGVPDAE